MRLVHLADIHLGYRQYQRLTATGINQREADVAITLQRVIDKIIEIKPELVLIAGDVFHTVRPPNPAILHAFIQFARLVQALPDATVIMVGGNHDRPRIAETGSILNLFSRIGITVVEGTAKRLTLHEHDLSVLAVPDMLSGRPDLVPDSASKRNVLLVHGEHEEVVPVYHDRLDRPPMKISRRDIRPEEWDYVALGHYHVYRSLAPNMFYSGSIDYTSLNPWGEIREERDLRRAEGRPVGPTDMWKGIIEYDLAAKTHRFHSVPLQRRWEDLDPIMGSGLSAALLNEEIRDAVEKCRGGIDGKVVRLVVKDVPRHILRELDHKALREYKRKALHFHLDARRPEVMRPTSGQAAPGRRASLADTVREKLQTRVLTEDIDRSELVELGLSYLREADALAGAAMGEELA